MKVKLFDVIWNTEGQDVDLPKEVVVDVLDDTDDYIGDAIDAACDEYEYCIISCVA